MKHSYRRTLACLAFCTAGSALGQTMVAPAIPVIQHETGASAVGAAWIVTAFLLVGAVATPLVVRLGRMYGNRRFVVLLMTLYAVGSLVAAVGCWHRELAIIVAGRLVQGVSAGVVPLSFAIIRDHVPPERATGGVVLVNAMLALGGSISLPLGGFVIDHFGVVWIFGVSAVSATTSALVVAVFVAELPHTDPKGRIDVVGAVLLSAGLAALVLGLSNAGHGGLASPQSAGLLGVGVLLLVLWGAVERRQHDPIVDVSLLGSPSVLRLNITTLLFGFGVFGSFFLFPLLLQLPTASGGPGLNATQAGLMAMPVAIVNSAASPLVGPVSRRWGPKVPVLVGGALGAATMAVVALLPAYLPALLVASVLWGTAYSAAMAAVSNLLIQVVPANRTGEVAGMNVIIRNVGSALGAQVGAGVIAIGEAAGLRPVAAVGAAFGVAGVACLVSVVCTALITTPSHSNRRTLRTRC